MSSLNCVMLVYMFKDTFLLGTTHNCCTMFLYYLMLLLCDKNMKNPKCSKEKDSYRCCTRVNFVSKKHLLLQMNLLNSGLENGSIKNAGPFSLFLNLHKDFSFLTIQPN